MLASIIVYQMFLVWSAKGKRISIRNIISLNVIILYRMKYFPCYHAQSSFLLGLSNTRLNQAHLLYILHASWFSKKKVGLFNTSVIKN